MPLILLDDLSKKQLFLNGAYCFYEFLKNASPRSINGYPCFFSFLYLNKEDTDRLIEKFKDIERVLGNV